jgi:hypothetical protein
VDLLLLCEGFANVIDIGGTSYRGSYLLPHPRCTFATMKIGQVPHDYVSQSTSNTFQGRSELVLSFVDKVSNAIDDNSFVSLIVRGAKSKKPTKKTVDESKAEVETLRGSIRKIQGRLVQLNNGKNKKRKDAPLLLQLTIKYHLATDIVRNIELSNVQDILTSLIGSPSVASEWGEQAVRSQPLQGAMLETTDEVWDLSLVSNPTMKRLNVKGTNSRVSSTLDHDRIKSVPLSNDAEFFKILGVTMAGGKPRPGMASKVRQHFFKLQMRKYSPRRYIMRYPSSSSQSSPSYDNVKNLWRLCRHSLKRRFQMRRTLKFRSLIWDAGAATSHFLSISTSLRNMVNRMWKRWESMFDQS